MATSLAPPEIPKLPPNGTKDVKFKAARYFYDQALRKYNKEVYQNEVSQKEEMKKMLDQLAIEREEADPLQSYKQFLKEKEQLKVAE